VPKSYIILTEDVKDPAGMAEYGRLAGQAMAGAGEKVAVIDTGLDFDNPMFRDKNVPGGAFKAPTGFPKFDNAGDQKLVVGGGGSHGAEPAPEQAAEDGETATAEQGNGRRMTSAVSGTRSLTRPDLLGPLLSQATGDDRWRQVEASLITGGKSNLTYLLRSPAGELASDFHEESMLRAIDNAHRLLSSKERDAFDLSRERTATRDRACWRNVSSGRFDGANELRLMLRGRIIIFSRGHPRRAASSAA